MKLFSSMLKCAGVLLFMFFFVGTVAADGPPSRKYKDHNWENSMGAGGFGTEPGNGSGQMCVNLASDNILHIKLYINIKHPNFLANMRPMLFKYSASIDGVNLGTGYTTVAQPGDFVAINNNGNPDDYYKATYNVPYDLTVYCRSDETHPNNEHNFTITYQLIYIDQSNQDVAYPVGSYPSAWPSSEYTIPSSLVDEPTSDTKNVCCNNLKLKRYDDGTLMATDWSESNDVHQIVGGDTNSGSTLLLTESQKVLDVLATPNPFNEEMKVQFMTEQKGNTSLELIDIQGRITNRMKYESVTAGLQTVEMNLADLVPGIYYLRLSNNEQTRLVKLVKAMN